MNYVLAIDIGGTSVKIGVVDKETIIESVSIKNIWKGKQDRLVKNIQVQIISFLKKYDIKKIGVGCPGEINNGVVVLATNLGWRDFNLKEQLQNKFPTCKIYLENDGNAAVLAEMKYGNLRNVSCGLFIVIGRGVGGAIIIDNKILHGAYNRGGNFGHMTFKRGGRLCGCGRKGCFETYASVSGLAVSIRETNDNSINKIKLGKIGGFMISEMVEQGDETVKKGVKLWNDDLAEGLLDFALIFDPTHIVLAGGITESGLIDINNINKKLESQDYNNIIVEISKFKGKTGLVGCAALTDINE